MQQEAFTSRVVSGWRRSARIPDLAGTDAGMRHGGMSLLFGLALLGSLPSVSLAQAVTVPAAELPSVIPASAVAASSAERAGYDFLEKGWVDDAIAAFESALAIDPDALTVRRGLAVAYQRAGRDQAAWDAYNAVLAIDAADETALRAVGEMGVYRSEWQSQGIEALNALLIGQPGDVHLRAQRALLLGYQQRFEAAIADYDLLLAADQQQSGLPVELLPALWVNAAQIYTYSDRTATALPLFERYQSAGAELEPSATLAYATALRKQGRAGEALPLLEDLNPGSDREAFDRQLSLALVYQEIGDVEGARAVLQPLLDDLPQELAQRRAVASALVSLEPTPELLPALEQLLADPESMGFLQFRIAQIQLQLENWEAARQSLLAYQATTPDLDIGSEFLLAELDRQMGELEASGDRYASLLTLQIPERITEDQQLDALRGLAAIRFEQQRLDEAERLYRQVIARRSDDLTGRQTFAELLLAQDKPKQSLAQFAAAQAIASQQQQAKMSQAQIAQTKALSEDIALSQDQQSPVSLLIRQRQIRRSFLRRRGFQPRWERY